MIPGRLLKKRPGKPPVVLLEELPGVRASRQLLRIQYFRWQKQILKPQQPEPPVVKRLRSNLRAWQNAEVSARTEEPRSEDRSRSGHAPNARRGRRDRPR